MSKHWSDEDLINSMYGIGPEDSHLTGCEDCRSRWLRIQARRREALRSVEIPPSLLGAQREAIRNRVAGRSARGWTFRVSPVFAVLALVILSVILTRPVPEPPTIAQNLTQQQPKNDEFFTEVYSMVESPEPWATEAMYGLFEE